MGLSYSPMNRRLALAVLFVGLFAVTRIPGLLPANFSVAYALVFCAGVYLRGPLGWWLPLATMLGTDLALNLWYAHRGFQVWDAADLESLLFNYAAYLALLGLGRRFRPRSSLLGLLGGGIFGAFLFYFITNTAAWLFNPYHAPEYTRNLAGWLIALTKGTTGFPSTLAFFLKTLVSGGLFTALFVAAEKMTAESPADKSAGAREPAEAEPVPAAEPQEAEA
jgi:hypothetical protein